jgi:hypothetical protein
MGKIKNNKNGICQAHSGQLSVCMNKRKRNQGEVAGAFAAGCVVHRQISFFLAPPILGGASVHCEVRLDRVDWFRLLPVGCMRAWGGAQWLTFEISCELERKLGTDAYDM